MQDLEDRADMALARLEESYRQQWFEAVTTEPLDSCVIFDSREDFVFGDKAAGAKFGWRKQSRESTVLELFTDQHYANEGDFDARVAKIVIDAHKAGSVEATKLLNDMAAAFAGQKV